MILPCIYLVPQMCGWLFKSVIRPSRRHTWRISVEGTAASLSKSTLIKALPISNIQLASWNVAAITCAMPHHSKFSAYFVFQLVSSFQHFTFLHHKYLKGLWATSSGWRCPWSLQGLAFKGPLQPKSFCNSFIFISVQNSLKQTEISQKCQLCWRRQNQPVCIQDRDGFSPWRCHGRVGEGRAGGTWSVGRRGDASERERDQSLGEFNLFKFNNPDISCACTKGMGMWIQLLWVLLASPASPCQLSCGVVPWVISHLRSPSRWCDIPFKSV